MGPVLGSVALRLLVFASVVIVPATNESFVAKDHFLQDTSSHAKVRICGFGENFRRWFLEGEGKIEEPTNAQSVLCRYTLQAWSVDAPIIEELGNELKAETTLATVYSLMAKQSKGEKGDLLVSKDDSQNTGNIFYVKDAGGILRTVLVSWHITGWVICAVSIRTDRTKWNEWEVGHQVFSRLSNASQLPANWIG